MRGLFVVAACALTASCSHGKAVSPPASNGVTPAVPVSTVAQERKTNEGAYRFLYLPEAERLKATNSGGWVVIAGGRVVPASGQQILPAVTMDAAIAEAAKAAPDAQHRFVFQVGEDGDVEWPMGGCELPHVLGTRFIALLERDDVRMKLSPSAPSVTYVRGDQTSELAVKGSDTRMYVAPQVGAPGAAGTAGATYCVSTGFGGFATMSPASAAGLEMWEIPGAVHVTDGVYQGGDCRRARARFSWANTPLDFTVPVAIWPK